VPRSLKLMQKTVPQSAYFYSLAATGMIALAGIATGVLSTRLLGARGRGELTALLLLPGLIGRLGNVGMLQAVAFLDNPARNQKPTDRIPAVALIAALGMGCLFVLLLLPFLSFLLPNLSSDLLIPAGLCLLYVPFNFAFSVLLGEHMAEGNFAAYSMRQVLVGLAQLTLMTAFWRAQVASPTTFGLAVVLAVVVVLLGDVSSLRRITNAGQMTWNSAMRVLAKAWEFTKPELAGLALLRCDVLLLARLVSNEDLGFYSVALAVAMGQAVTASPLAQICFHSTSNAPDRLSAVRSLARQFRLLQLLFLGIGVLAIAVAPVLIRTAFGVRFAASIRSTDIMILTMLVWSCSQVLEGGLRGMDLSRLCSWGNLLGLAILLCSGPILVHFFGIAGMAAAALAGQSVSLATKLFFLWKETHARLSGFWALSQPGLKELWDAGMGLRQTVRRFLPGRFGIVTSS
jgi:O-antigen/teichoic acid export membrane protein